MDTWLWDKTNIWNNSQNLFHKLFIQSYYFWFLMIYLSIILNCHHFNLWHNHGPHLVHFCIKTSDMENPTPARRTHLSNFSCSDEFAPAYLTDWCKTPVLLHFLMLVLILEQLCENYLIFGLIDSLLISDLSILLLSLDRQPKFHTSNFLLFLDLTFRSVDIFESVEQDLQCWLWGSMYQCFYSLSWCFCLLPVEDLRRPFITS